MDLKGKSVLFLGSSVTFGSASGGVSFADMMQETCGIHMIKEAVSGTTLADVKETSYVARLKRIDKGQKIDLFICQLSTNDAVKKIEPAKTEQAIRFILEYVKDTFDCPIVFYTGTYFDDSNYERLVEMLEALQGEYDFKILNLWRDPEMLAVCEADRKRYMADPIHPSEVGYREWWTPRFISFCESI